MNKVIFLDIDGVMNSEIDYMLDSTEKRYDISPRCIKLLNTLIDETDALLVISSTWRISHTMEEIQKAFDDEGFRHKIDSFTPRISMDCVFRGNEIYKWIKDNERKIDVNHYYNFHSYVILDDDSDMLYWQKDNFILVDGYTGLTPSIIYRAKRILNRSYK